MLALIDGDIICYRAGFGCEKRISFTNADGEIDHIYEIEPVSHALHNVKLILNRMLEDLATHDYKLFLTKDNDPTNFRKSIAKTQEYKGNRKDMKRPEHYHAIREYMIKSWGAVVIEGQEADDEMGIIQYKHWSETLLLEDLNTIICSIDKDLDMIPGHHFNFVKKSWYMLEEQDSWATFYRQMLKGDRVDNIPGIYGIGPVRAEKLIPRDMNKDKMLETVKKIYKENGLSAERLQEIGDLLWIRREPNEIWSEKYL
jgi:5'-3' exonuclease